MSNVTLASELKALPTRISIPRNYRFLDQFKDNSPYVIAVLLEVPTAEAFTEYKENQAESSG